MYLIKTEVLRFIIVGCTAVLTDLTVYWMLKSIISISIAKGLSFIAGSLISYAMNKFWTFESTTSHHTRELFRFFLLYSVSLLANIVMNKLTLWVFPQSILLAFLVATATSTLLNFVGMKFWVFASTK